MRIGLPITTALFICVLYASCVSIPMPTIDIPQGKNDFRIAVMAGSNGLNLNSTFSLDGQWVLNGAANAKYSPFAPVSVAGEGGIGFVSRQKDWLLVLDYGGGHFLLKPSLSGSSDAIKKVEGDFRKVTLGINHVLSNRSGFVARVSRSWVDASATYNRPDLSFQEKFSIGIGAEGMLYFKMSQQENWLLAIGGAYSFRSTASTTIKENLIYPSIVFISAGYRFNLKKRTQR